MRLIGAVYTSSLSTKHGCRLYNKPGCLLFLTVELCHLFWENLWSLLIYAIKISNSMSAILLELIDFYLKVFCAVYDCRCIFHPFTRCMVFFLNIICLWLMGGLPKGNKANTACSNCVHRANIVLSSSTDLQ